jgi:hypothetical protein
MYIMGRALGNQRNKTTNGLPKIDIIKKNVAVPNNKLSCISYLGAFYYA